MLAYLGDDVNTTFVFSLSPAATNSCISFIEVNNVCTASQIFFGVGFPFLKGSSSPAACRWSFIPANSNNSGSQGVPEFTATTSVNIWLSSAHGTSTQNFRPEQLLRHSAKSDLATITTLAAPWFGDHRQLAPWPTETPPRISGPPPTSVLHTRCQEVPCSWDQEIFPLLAIVPVLLI